MAMKPQFWRALMISLIAGAALFVAFGSYVQMANDLFGLSLLPSNKTAAYTVLAVEPGSAAARAGIRAGDSVAPMYHDLLSRATAQFPPPGARAEALVNGTRRVTLVEGKGAPAQPIFSFTVIRLCFLAIAALLAWRRPDDRSSRTLVWFLFAIGLGIALNNHEFGSPLISLIVLQIGSVSLLLFAFGAAARFAAVFPGGTASGAPRILAASATLVSSLAIATVMATSLSGYGVAVRLAAASAVYAAFLIVIALLAAILLERYVYGRPADRQRRLWIFLILAVGILGPTIDLALQIFATYNRAVDEYGSLSLLVIPVGLAYVILRHRVIDVGFVLNRAAVYGLMSIVIVGIFVVVETLLGKYVENTSHVTSTAVQLAVALTLGFSIRAIHARVDRFVDTVLFRERHEAEAAIRTFAHDAAYISDARILAARCVETAMRYGGATQAGIWMRSDLGDYAPVQSTFPAAPVADENDPAILAMRARRVVVDLAACRSALPGALGLPMIVRGELLGVLVCGPKAQDDAYAPDEREALEAMASSVGHAYDALDVRELRRRLEAAEGAFATGGALGMS